MFLYKTCKVYEKSCLFIFLLLAISVFSDDEKTIVSLFNEKFCLEITSQNITKICQGLTNHNYLIKSGSKKYFVHIGTQDASYLGIDRKKEKIFHEKAASIGIAPPILYFDCATGNMILPFVKGHYYGKLNRL